jgi:hypothetical protein|tara:strand:- start:105 stop:563 length:459 start_codon:yes stop_codon:yes gene_type:complete
MKTLIYSLVPTVVAYNTGSVPKFVREAEIKHGRVAMVSSVTIPLLDTLSPDGLGVNFVNNMPVENQLLLLGIFGCSEFSQMLKTYNFPSDTNSWFTFKDTHEPGNYNFDPLNISNPNNIDKIKSNEMFVGRLAMLGVFSEMLSEFCFQNSVV